MKNENKVVIQQESILERKIWYRIAKTIYIAAYILVVVIIFFFGYLSKPYTDVDPLSSVVTCNNGRKLAPNKDALIFKDGTLGYSNDQEVRKLCFDPITEGATPVGTILSASEWEELYEKNYTVQVGYKTKGSWTNPLKFWGIGLAITFLFFEIIKRTFLYIAIGKKFFK